jgi:hypothetical protein
MTDRDQLFPVAEPGRCAQGLLDIPERVAVIGRLNFANGLDQISGRVAPLVFHHGLGFTDALDKTTRDELALVHFEQLILDGRTPTIDDQNLTE